MSRFSTRRTLLATTIIAGALAASPAFAQAPRTPQSPPAAEEDTSTIVVTGSLIRRADNGALPVTTVQADALDTRGISTIQDAIQTLAANNGPALTNSFSANGAFAAGASAASLRGLSTNSTLVIFNGLRAAYYPLADDGSRNFVDLNTIPDDVVDRIEVLRDGASSSYGADAIAGVINIITKKEVKGLQARAEGGISSRGDASSYRLGVTAGFGDLDENGLNAYVSGYYYKSNGLKNSERPYPYNTDDLRQVCNGTSCGPNNVVNGSTDPNATFLLSTAANFLVRPGTANTTTGAFTAVAGSRWQNLNNNCGRGTPYTLTAAETVGTVAPNTVCQYDYTNLYGTIQPEVERFGGSAHVSARLGGGTEAYLELNFMQSTVSYSGFPATVIGNANTGIDFPRFSTSTAFNGTNAVGSFVGFLPVFVCPERVNCATSPNRRLNPNNPFAAAGQDARIIGRDPDQVTYNQTRNRAYRAAFGVNGNITDAITFDIGGTVMHTDLRRRTNGYNYIQRLLDVIADGTYNFVNPSANTQEVRDYLSPENITNATSDLAQIQASVGTKLADLPGGGLEVAVGGSFYYEAVNAPSANDDYNGPRQRYFTLNAFGTVGDRTVASAFGEIDAPLLDILTVNLAGRYDSYSSGQSAFSPKASLRFQPIRQVTFRGSYSRGFRIPSFAEANALPTTGFVTNNVSLFNDAYLAQYGCSTTTFSTCPVYIRSGSYGQTTLASPNLDPEKSRSFTGGVVFEPVSNVTLTFDYYNIKKTNVITQPSNAPALLAYYNNQPIPAGYTVIADAPDPNFPNARPRVAFIQAQLINANTQKVEGLDFGANVNFKVADGFRIRSQLDASLILRLETIFPDGTVERYDGTLGNFNLTAGSGTPKWRGVWQNSFIFGDSFEVNTTANYVGGYDLSATDQGTGYRDCGLDPGYSPTGCRVKSYITFDLNARVKINEKVSFYATVNNLFDRLPPIDVVTYGAHLYNPVQGGNGILGRYFKAGARFGF